MLSSALLIMVGLCLAVEFVLEQPRSSLMALHPRFDQLLELAGIGAFKLIRYVATSMGAFGGPTQKATSLWGSIAWLEKLGRTYTREHKERHRLVTEYIDKHGKRRWNGSKNLKSSQVYPRGYGKAFAQLMKAACKPENYNADLDGLEEQTRRYREDGLDVWMDAELSTLWELVAPEKRAKSV